MNGSRSACLFLGVLGLSVPATAQDTYSGTISFGDYHGQVVTSQTYIAASNSDFSLTNGASRGDIKNEPFAAAYALIAAGVAGTRNRVETSLNYGIYLDGARPDAWVPVRYRGRFEFGASGNDAPVAGSGTLSWDGNGSFGFSISSEASMGIYGTWGSTRLIRQSDEFNSSIVSLDSFVQNSSNPNDVNGQVILSNGAALGYYVAGGQADDGFSPLIVNDSPALKTYTGEFSGLTYLHANELGSASAGVSMSAGASFCLTDPSVGCTEFSYNYSGALPDGQFVTVSTMIDPEFWVDPEYLATNGLTRLRVSDGVANASPVPEQSTWALLTLGLAGVACRLRPRKAARVAPLAV